MSARWEQGRATIDVLLADRRLERVTPSREVADLLIGQARRHLATAEAAASLDPTAGFQIAYDAARKALTAILANQGLRPRGDGAHAVLLTAALAQLDPPMGRDLRQFDWLRRTRNGAEYPFPDTPPVTVDDVNDALPLAEAIVAIAERVIPNMPVY